MYVRPSPPPPHHHIRACAHTYTHTNTCAQTHAPVLTKHITDAYAYKCTHSPYICTDTCMYMQRELSLIHI